MILVLSFQRKHSIKIKNTSNNHELCTGRAIKPVYKMSALNFHRKKKNQIGFKVLGKKNKNDVVAEYNFLFYLIFNHIHKNRILMGHK